MYKFIAIFSLSYQGRQVFSRVDGDIVDLEDDVTQFDDTGLLGQTSAHNPTIRQIYNCPFKLESMDC